MVEEWRKAVERNKAQRIKWRDVLGYSLNRFVYDMIEGGYSKGEIEHTIIKKTRDYLRDSKVPDRYKIELKRISWLDVVKRIKIGVSARITEEKMINNGR